MHIGKRIFLKRELPEAEIIAGFTKLPASNVADCMERTNAMSPRIKLMSSPKKEMCGPAFTVHTRAGDNLAIFAALKYCQPGDVIVVNNEGDNSRAVIGEVMMTWLRDQRHAAGIVVDGPMRDIDTLKDWEMPIYATGTTPDGPYREGPGEVNVPISCGNISVNPGDIILGDNDGVIAIPRKDAADLLPKAQAFHVKDDANAAAFSKGTSDLSWLDEALEEKGFNIIDDVYRP
ncbi:RraA family protein [Lactobacillus sp. ESL0791]|uniref:RraA family protein n=1 Tax=Lactobacillus sp. ESL0791 TaxID=2983234 RepID=UPI0023F8F8B2|nr:RraA family protein [Lactobacillus sp. ESL0791]MDF7638993.1 RraA family protein [Lactobacillus sp. ESL0791]